MRSSKVVSITFPPEMALEAEQLARRENRTMSELMREAFRRYKRERDWDEANALGRAKAKRLALSEADVVRIIREYRAEEASPSRSGGRKKRTAS